MTDRGVERVLCAAMTRRWVIGDKGRMPWHIPEELQLFRTLTWGHSLIMGRKTFEAIGRPLPGRRNVVLSRSLAPTPGVLVCTRLEEALAVAAKGMRRLFFIGGADLYSQALSRADSLHISWIRADYPGDTRFSDLEPGAWQVVQVTEYRDFRHVVYRRRP